MLECGTMRGDAAWRARGHAPGMPTACPRRAAAKAKVAPMGRRPRNGHAAAKAKAAPRGQATKAWACNSQGQGSPPWARSSQGMGMQHPRLGRARSSQGLGVHAATKAKARSQGRGMLAWALWHAPGRRQQGPWGYAAKAIACRVPEGQHLNVVC